jgi:hypothetical protein
MMIEVILEACFVSNFIEEGVSHFIRIVEIFKENFWEWLIQSAELRIKETLLGGDLNGFSLHS